ncbi:DUF5691 domain-containing protein [Hymenobacter negativus]|uniref:SWIM-type domain-containing protein n=1 Tax=Hymenobacter negativus TaxID=2795026 RepID=A0ABS3QIP6_9BACT|nr:DUF5691 domain-containing protein [Hymenobacter negativus]MBO2011116.1 hypothetical protein [Hymenobacter negativus]
MISFTEAQAQSLITDSGTLKRGQELAKPTKWANLGRTDTAAWGECAGSGSKPYLTGIDLTEPAFKCSCPSRVFPCKHGAGLLLLMARQPDLLSGSTPPVWLNEWLGKRQQTQEKKAEKAVAPAAKAAKAPASELPTAEGPAGAATLFETDVATAAPAAAAQPGGITVDPKRLARMANGADDLAAWLEDLMRAGLATLDQQSDRFWEGQAARLVDNQLPGLASTLRELATLRHSLPDWPPRLLGRLGELYLLVRAFQNLPHLSPDARPEVLQMVGVNLKKDDLIANATPVADTWRVLGQFVWEEDRLTARRTWLSGRNTGRTALVLEFSFGGMPFNSPFIPQGSYLGELAFYPGLLPLRAAPVHIKFDGTVPSNAMPAGQPISQLLHDYADALARQPWLREWPATLSQVLPAPLPDGSWQLHHATEPGILPLRLADEDFGWQLLAESGGQPVTLFGEWDGRAFRPLTSWAPDGAGETSPPSFLSRGEGKPDDVGPESFGSSSPRERGPGDEANGAQLLRVALLGTRQSGETIPAFPTPAASPEQQLLLAAGTLALMRKAGHQPVAAAGPPLTPAPPELLPVIGPKGTDHLHQMLVNGLHLDLLPDYLTRLAARDRLVPPALLVPLLHQAGYSTKTRAALAPVLGSRGHWLAGLNPEWAKLTDGASLPTPDSPETATWETGTLVQRRAWLTERFAQAPDEARALLLAALPTEPAKAQEAFLEILAQHLHPDVEPMLEALLKARGQEVRRLATELLVQLPGAALTERLWARATPLLSAKRKLLGLGKASLEITLPDTWDKSWLLDGIEEKNARFLSPYGTNSKATIGPATARLANLLALLPPHHWTAHLNLTPPELLAAALDSEWALPLLSAWAQSTLLHHDAAFAAAFVELWMEKRPALAKANSEQGIDWVALAALLTPADQQACLLEPVLRRVLQQAPGWTADIGFVPAPWPRALAYAVVKALANKLAPSASPTEPIHELRQLAWLLPQTVAPAIAPADIAWVIERIEAIVEPNIVLQPQLHAFVDILRFQAELEASLSE